MMPPNIESKRSSNVIGTKENFIANKKAITLTIILKKDAENEDDRAAYLRVIRFVRAIQKAPMKTSNIPVKETSFEPKGSAEITTPEKPRIIAEILTKFIFSSKKKWDMTKSIKGELKRTG
jgi:hypothetical protein